MNNYRAIFWCMLLGLNNAFGEYIFMDLSWIIHFEKINKKNNFYFLKYILCISTNYKCSKFKMIYLCCCCGCCCCILFLQSLLNNIALVHKILKNPLFLFWSVLCKLPRAKKLAGFDSNVYLFWIERSIVVMSRATCWCHLMIRPRNRASKNTAKSERCYKAINKRCQILKLFPIRSKLFQYLITPLKWIPFIRTHFCSYRLCVIIRHKWLSTF